MRLSSSACFGGRPALVGALGIVLAAVTGCSATVAGSAEAVDAEVASRSSAVIVVERSSVAGSEGTRGEAVARFLRVRGASGNDALRLVGANVELPPTGACVPVAALAVAPDPSSSVQLVDVGAVTMEANGVATALNAARVPDVVDRVSGVVYARAAEADLLPARAPYTVRVAGGESELGGVVVTAAAPADPADVRVSATEAGLDVTWEAPRAPGDDVIYVDVSSRVGGSTLRCAFADTGHALVGASAVGTLDDGVVAVHRLHRERFRRPLAGAAQALEGEVRFDFARTVTFTRR